MRRTTLIGTHAMPIAHDGEMASHGALKLFFAAYITPQLKEVVSQEAETLLTTGRDVLVVDEPRTLESVITRAPDCVVLFDLTQSDAEDVPWYRHIDALVNAGIHVYACLGVHQLTNERQRMVELGLEIPNHLVPDRILYKARQLEFCDFDMQELAEYIDSAMYESRESCESCEAVLEKLRQLAESRVVDFSARGVASGSAAYIPMFGREVVVAYVEVGLLPGDVLMSASRLAAPLGAEVRVVCVRNQPSPSSPAAKEEDAAYARLREHVEDMGLELETVYGDDTAQALSDVVRTYAASDIVVAHRHLTLLHRLLLPVQPGLVERLSDLIGEARVHVVRAHPEEGVTHTNSLFARFARGVRLREVVLCVLAVLVGALLGRLLVAIGFRDWVGYVAIALAVAVAGSCTRSYALSALTVVFAVLCADFFFAIPYYSLDVAGKRSAFSLVAVLPMLLAAGLLATRASRASVRSRRREAHTQALYDLNRSLSHTTGSARVVDVALDSVGRLFGRSCALYTTDPFSATTHTPHAASVRSVVGDVSADVFGRINEQALAHWVFENGTSAGRGTDVHEESDVLYVPLSAHDTVRGVLAISSKELLDQADQSFLDLVANQLGLALERQSLARSHAQDARMSLVSQIRDTFLCELSQSVLDESALIHDIAEALSTAKEDEERDGLARLVSDESSRTELVASPVLAELLRDGIRTTCDVRQEVTTAVNEVRAGLAGRVIELLPGDSVSGFTCDAALIRCAVRLILNASTSYVENTGIVSVEIHDYPDRVSVVISDNRPESFRGIEAPALDTTTDDLGVSHLTYMAQRTQGIQSLLALDAQEASFDPTSELARAVHIPLAAILDTQDEPNRRRLVRFDRLSYGVNIAAMAIRAHGGDIRQRFRLGGGAVINISIPRERS